MTDFPTPIAESMNALLNRIGYTPPSEPVEPEDEVDVQRQEQRWHTWTSRVPHRFQMANVDDFPVEVRDELLAWDGESNLLFVGPVGVGKTHAAVAATRRWHFDEGRTVHFWPVVELLDALRPRANEETDIAELVQAPILVLDDLATERATDWTAERLYALVNRRWLDERPTVVTTNVPPERLETALGERLLSRIAHDALVIRLRGSDRRRA